VPAASLALTSAVRGRRGLMFGMQQSAPPAATLLAGLAVPLIGLTVGWRWSFALAAGGAVLVAALVPARAGAPRASGAARSPVRIGPLIGVSVAAALGSASGISLGAFLVESAVAGGRSPAAAGTLLAAGSTLCVLTRIAVGWLADRRSSGHLDLVAGMLVLASLGYVALAGGTSTPLLIAGTVVAYSAGYGWSGRPAGPQGRRQEAGQIHKLMTEALGYDRYVAAGGDFGAMIAGWLALDHPEAVQGIHVTAPNLRPAGGGWFTTEPPDDFTQEEKEYLLWELGYLQPRMAYANIQGSSPQTLAYAEGDSPVGQAAWLLEKFQRWTDEAGRPPDEIFGLDRLLTAVMIYLVTDSFASSLWAYPGVYLDPPTLESGQRVEVPVGLVACKDPLVPVPPRSFVERVYNIVRWTDLPEAGHFAAFQESERVREDLQGFLRLLRDGATAGSA
jgi:pimeloyl-ACP methyl ester carboxylesterase